jgi:hypothetical protein
LKCRNSTLASRSDGRLRTHPHRHRISTTSADSGDREHRFRSIMNTGSGDHEHRLGLPDWTSASGRRSMMGRHH